MLFVVDVQNLWYGAVEAFGRSARVDYKKLLRLVTNSEEHPIEFYRADAYIVTDKSGKQDVFSRIMENFGFKVFKTEVDLSRSREDREAWRAGMVENVIRSLANFDLFCIATGNSDFAVVLQEAKAKNMETRVFAFSDDISNTLREQADQVIFLHKGILRDENSRS